MKKHCWHGLLYWVFACLLAGQAFANSAAFNYQDSKRVRAVYLPPYALTQRFIDVYIHQARQLGLNGAVLHLKDPRGRIFWPSRAAGTKQRPATSGLPNIKGIVSTLKRNNIWTIAKLDVFADHALVDSQPEMGLTDRQTGRPWKDKNGLFWANPYDRRVWEYVIGLAEELAALGLDEIQFDYVRFPSDGNLARISFPIVSRPRNRSQCIASFLETAYKRLHPMQVKVSAAVFGLTAWKKHDFGVGQVLEKMAPHLDLVCPMFYPSHFPQGFLGKQQPGRYPELIMKLSTQRIKRRTSIAVRPWIQDFWYGPAQVQAQLSGLTAAGAQGWSAWNPSGKYKSTFAALAERLGVSISEPKLYPDLSDLGSLPEKIIVSAKKPVNLTNFRKGYSVISLQPATNKSPVKATTPAKLLMTMEESILDQILYRRKVDFGHRTSKAVKARLAARILCSDLGADSRRMRPRPIFINWKKDCRFTYAVPETIGIDFHRPVPLHVPAVARRPLFPNKVLHPAFFMD